MSEPKETTAPAPDEDPDVRFAKFMAEPMPPFVPRSKRRKAIRVEVSQRTYDAVRANPSELKLLAKDRHGNPVVERPARPRMTYAEMVERNQQYLQNRQPTVGFSTLPNTGRDPVDQRWSAQRTWTGETRYRPDNGGSNPFVTHQYDIFDVLKEDER